MYYVSLTRLNSEATQVRRSVRNAADSLPSDEVKEEEAQIDPENSLIENDDEEEEEEEWLFHRLETCLNFNFNLIYLTRTQQRIP